VILVPDLLFAIVPSLRLLFAPALSVHGSRLRASGSAVGSRRPGHEAVVE
jgi:hypothetical protein